MKKQEEFSIVRETLLSEIEELEQRLALLKKRVSNKDLIGVGNAITTCIGNINVLIGKYQILNKLYE